MGSKDHSNLDGILERFERHLEWYANTVRTVFWHHFDHGVKQYLGTI